MQNKDIAKQFHTVVTQNKNKEKILDIFEYKLTIALHRAAFISEQKHTKGWMKPWPTILSTYQLKGIFNKDEFGLFYRAVPSTLWVSEVNFVPVENKAKTASKIQTPRFLKKLTEK